MLAPTDQGSDLVGRTLEISPERSLLPSSAINANHNQKPTSTGFAPNSNHRSFSKVSQSDAVGAAPFFL